MNIIKQCTFFDRFRNSLIELDDLIEENYSPICGEPSENEFYLIFYFTANWLPDTFNKYLNEKLELFYTNRKENFKNFELVFISSDKTTDSYKEFLGKNKFIRYSLEFREQDLKSQLCKYFNVNGIPYLTIASFKLDSNLKITHFQTEKTNIKHQILSDEGGFDFPWSKNNENKNTSRNLIPETNVLDELLNNLVEIKSIDQEKQLIKNPLSIKNENTFVYILLGSNEISTNKRVVESIAEFWRNFHAKHKFIVVYFNFDKIDTSYSQLKVDWYTTTKRDLREKICQYYQVTHVPKLLIVDVKNGELLNNSVKFALLEYIHEFCNKQIESVKSKPIKSNELMKIEIDQIQENENFNIDFNINFDFDMYDIYEHKSKRSKNKKKGKRKKIDELLKDLNENLIDITTGEKFISKEKSNENESTINYFLFYFCSYFTATTNSNLFDMVIKFLNYMKEKIECNIKVVLISSDQLEEDYNKLIKKYQSGFCDKKSSSSKRVEFDETCLKNDNYNDLSLCNYKRLALNFNSKSIKEKLFNELHISGIPWFSLINETSGEVLCENLKIFILNSQLREIVF